VCFFPPFHDDFRFPVAIACTSVAGIGSARHRILCIITAAGHYVHLVGIIIQSSFVYRIPPSDTSFFLRTSSCASLPHHSSSRMPMIYTFSIYSQQTPKQQQILHHNEEMEDFQKFLGAWSKRHPGATLDQVNGCVILHARVREGERLCVFVHACGWKFCV
jgi:hypothetical protein